MEITALIKLCERVLYQHNNILHCCFLYLIRSKNRKPLIGIVHNCEFNFCVVQSIVETFVGISLRFTRLPLPNSDVLYGRTHKWKLITKKNNNKDFFDFLVLSDNSFHSCTIFSDFISSNASTTFKFHWENPLKATENPVKFASRKLLQWKFSLHFSFNFKALWITFPLLTLDQLFSKPFKTKTHHKK